MRKQITKIQKEDGFASLTIAIVIIIVLALITVGFAQLARREQQSALNKQLAAQANYAAESGINDVENYIRANPDTLDSIKSTESCLEINSNAPIGGFISGIVDGDRDVTYTCVMVDPEPESIGADIGPLGSWTTTFEPSATLKTLDIQWGSLTGKTPKSNMSSNFQKATDWNAPAVLQVSITPLDAADRGSLVQNTFTVYAYPAEGGNNSVAYSSYTGQKGEIKSGACDTDTNLCTTKITGLPAAGSYLLRIVDYYDKSDVKVKGYTEGGEKIKFKKSQASVDVTGKSRNVLKRLKAQVPLNDVGRFDLPNFAIEAKNVCKKIQTTPTKTDYVPAGGGGALGASSADPCYLGE